MPTKTTARTTATIDQWFEQQDNAVDKVHRSFKTKRSRNRKTLDEIELGRRVSKRIAEEEKLFVASVVLARTIARFEIPGNKNYGLDLVEDASSELPREFRDMCWRQYGKVPSTDVFGGKRAAFKDHHEQVKSEIETEMRAELDAARDKSGMKKITDRLVASDIQQFANNLEVARTIYKRHAKLLTEKVFPEPYRSAIIEQSDYDPDAEEGIDVGDLHITDPAEWKCENEKQAREILANHKPKGASTVLRVIERKQE